MCVRVCEHELMDEKKIVSSIFVFFLLVWFGVYFTIRFNKCVHVNFSMISDEVIIPF